MARIDAWLKVRPLLRFVTVVVALLPGCFGVWYALSAYLAAPAVLLARPVLLEWLPELVEGVHLRDARLMVMSTFGELEARLVALEMADNQIAYGIDTRSLSYSIPFYAALILATPERADPGRLAWGLVALWLLLAAGIVATALKDLMLGLGPRFVEAPGAPPAEAVALAYQFSTIIVPPLAPVLLWAYGARDTSAFRSLLLAPLRPAQRSD